MKVRTALRPGHHALKHSMSQSGVAHVKLAFWNLERYMLTFVPVYNHVLRLNLITRQWNLVDNYGDIPGVRMGMCGCRLFPPV